MSTQKYGASLLMVAKAYALCLFDSFGSKSTVALKEIANKQSCLLYNHFYLQIKHFSTYLKAQNRQ